ncbi:hypothetical protein [Pararhizobium qamdonense]|uniref:hypothetical protein n=1 Tax=Pararhizobium qamdonense TaxID=3031126 RepID=UPI0023E1C0A9|nr:hypothetical protein [Pararhizobium qamdonense]
MARGYYLLAISPAGYSFVLGLEARTKAECDQTIRWMRVGQFNMEYAITSYDPVMAYFVAEDGNSYRPSYEPYTETAKNRFQLHLKGRRN